MAGLHVPLALWLLVDLVRPPLVAGHSPDVIAS
jgi:hypothetical protein